MKLLSIVKFEVVYRNSITLDKIVITFEYGVSITVNSKKLRVNHALATDDRKSYPPPLLLLARTLLTVSALTYPWHGSCFPATTMPVNWDTGHGIHIAAACKYHASTI